jgi:hypothetical protein
VEVEVEVEVALEPKPAKRLVTAVSGLMLGTAGKADEEVLLVAAIASVLSVGSASTTCLAEAVEEVVDEVVAKARMPSNRCAKVLPPSVAVTDAADGVDGVAVGLN